MGDLLSDFTNVISDPTDGRAVRDIIENTGDVFPDDGFRQNSYDRDYTFEEFEASPATSKIAGGYAGGSTGDENVMKFESNIFEYHILGAGQTITAPSISATGLNVGMDQGNDEGIEVSQGITARSRSAFTVGTSAPFFFKLRFTIPVVAGTDDCAMGFRKAEAYRGNIDDYDEMAALNVISGNITIETILNNDTTATQDTGDDWADAETHNLEVMVAATGAVTYKIDGVAPTVPATFSFDADEVVVPFFYFLHANASQAGAITLVSWECGLQSAMI